MNEQTQMRDRHTLTSTTRTCPWICKTTMYKPSKKVRLLHNIKIKCWENYIKNVS